MKATNQTSKKFNRNQSPARQTVRFELEDSQARRVCVAGTFNEWKPESGEMTQTENGKWIKEVTLAPGTYEYRFVVDGEWRSDPNADHAIANTYGERNSLVTVSRGS